MSRKQLIFPSLLLLTSAFVVAVQRDTFVRRWLLPEPIAEAKLRQVLPVFEVKGATFAQAVLKLGKEAGIPIEIDREVPEKLMSEDRELHLSLRNFTVAQTLRCLIQLRTNGRWIAVVATGEKIKVLPMTDPGIEMTMRMYPVNSMLPPSGTFPPTQPSVPGGLFSYSAAPPQDLREATSQSLQTLVKNEVDYDIGKSRAIFEWAGRLVIYAPAADLTAIESLLQKLRNLHANREN